MVDPRRSAIEAFLAAEGHGAAAVAPLAADASFRRYFRIVGSGGPLVLMDAPPAHEDIRPFAAVARYLAAQGFSAPAIVAADWAAGLLLLEDFGDDSFSRVLARQAAHETVLYKAAVDCLRHLHRLAPLPALPIGNGRDHHLPAYDAARLMTEAALFADWYLPAIGHTSPAGVAQRLRAVLAPLLDHVARRTDRLVLRDFHVDNLFHLPDRAGRRRVGLLDFQDAVYGHPAYDLVSLLQDSRRAVPEALESRLLAAYLADTGEDPAAFARDYAILGVQRSLKILGIFARLDRRDGKPGYLKHCPHIWTMIARNRSEPALAPLFDLLDDVVGPAIRRRAPDPA